MRLPLRVSWVVRAIWLLVGDGVTAVASRRKARNVRCMVRNYLEVSGTGGCCYFAKDCSRAHGKIYME